MDLKELEASVRAGTGGTLDTLTDNAPNNAVWQALLETFPLRKERPDISNSAG
jgi:hypothetical protein